MNKYIRMIYIVSLLAISTVAYAQKKEVVEPIPFGDMDSWLVRVVDESLLIGGKTKYLYEVAKGDTLYNNTPYHNKQSPWASSTVLAKVSGITKASISVFPEKRGNGYCARLETLFDQVKVLGLINIKVLASGTLFLGEMIEPIKDTKNPQSKLITGVPFKKRPKALQFDYKVTTGGDCIRATGFSKQKQLDRKDMAEVHILLQNRWEDEEGNIHAERVATGWKRFQKSVTTWQNGYRIPIYYGDITQKDFYKPYMKLRNEQDEVYYTRNSKGEMVPILEEKWSNSMAEPTHIILQFSSSNGGAYIGNPESKFWIDNVSLVY